jgi:hypothetical protein
MTPRPTYELSTKESFCHEYGRNDAGVKVHCDSGEWQEQRYVVFGSMSRSEYPPISFGMEMSREGDRWVVHSVAFGDGP